MSSKGHLEIAKWMGIAKQVGRNKSFLPQLLSITTREHITIHCNTVGSSKLQESCQTGDI